MRCQQKKASSFCVWRSQKAAAAIARGVTWCGWLNVELPHNRDADLLALTPLYFFTFKIVRRCRLLSRHSNETARTDIDGNR